MSKQDPADVLRELVVALENIVDDERTNDAAENRIVDGIRRVLQHLRSRGLIPPPAIDDVRRPRAKPAQQRRPPPLTPTYERILRESARPPLVDDPERQARIRRRLAGKSIRRKKKDGAS